MFDLPAVEETKLLNGSLIANADYVEGKLEERNGKLKAAWYTEISQDVVHPIHPLLRFFHLICWILTWFGVYVFYRNEGF